ncbi:MAG TPA: YabP/YqfC family sporulation protein, partial [Bacillota bacterium]|nr:YabP/YqfC family sporulation protein [Bacillota bacterium]
TNLDSYDQERVILETSSGVLEIRGEQLHIQQLNLEQGKVMIEGTVNALIYADDNLAKKGKGFFSKLAK